MLLFESCLLEFVFLLKCPCVSLQLKKLLLHLLMSLQFDVLFHRQIEYVIGSAMYALAYQEVHVW